MERERYIKCTKAWFQQSLLNLRNQEDKVGDI